MTKKPRLPGPRAATNPARRPSTYGADPYERVEISRDEAAPKPVDGRRRPSLGDFPAAAVAALDDLIAAAEGDLDHSFNPTDTVPLDPAELVTDHGFDLPPPSDPPASRRRPKDAT